MTMKESTQHRKYPDSYYYTQRAWDRAVGYGTVPDERNVEMRINEFNGEDNITLQQFWDLLDKHDWTYMLADDRRSYAQGKKERAVLRKYAGLGPEYEELFITFAKWGQRNLPAQDPSAEKPDRPAE